MRCRNCGKELQGEVVLFCPSCGKRLSEDSGAKRESLSLGKYCNQCGQELPEGTAVFCPHCGAKLPWVNEPDKTGFVQPTVSKASSQQPVPSKGPRREKQVLGILIGIAGVLLVACICTFFLFFLPKQKLTRQIALGNKYLEELRYDDAVLAFQEAVKISPQSVAGYWGLGIAYQGQANEAMTVDWQRSQLERSAEAYQKVIDLQPDRAEAYYSIVDVYFAQSDTYREEAPDKAAEYLETAEQRLREMPIEISNSEATSKKKEEVAKRKEQISNPKQMFPLTVRVSSSRDNSKKEYSFRYVAEEQTLYIKTDSEGYVDSDEVLFSTVGDRFNDAEQNLLSLDGEFLLMQHPFTKGDLLKTIWIQSADNEEKYTIEKRSNEYFIFTKSIDASTGIEIKQPQNNEYWYDNNGFCVKESLSDGLAERNYTVDELGHVLNAKAIYEGDGDFEYVIERDENGRIQEIMHQEAEYEYEYRYQYRYDNEGRVSEITVYYVDNQSTQELRAENSFSYDEEGRLLSFHNNNYYQNIEYTIDISYEEKPWWENEETLGNTTEVSGSFAMWNTYRTLVDTWLKAYEQFSAGDNVEAYRTSGNFDPYNLGMEGLLAGGDRDDVQFALEDLNRDGQAELIILENAEIIDVFCWLEGDAWYNITPGGLVMTLYGNGVIGTIWGHGSHDYVYFQYDGGTEMKEVNYFSFDYDDAYGERVLHDSDYNVISEEVKTAYEDSLGKSNCIKYPVTQENLDNLQRGQIGLLVGGFV